MKDTNAACVRIGVKFVVVDAAGSRPLAAVAVAEHKTTAFMNALATSMEFGHASKPELARKLDDSAMHFAPPCNRLSSVMREALPDKEQCLSQVTTKAMGGRFASCRGRRC